MPVTEQLNQELLIKIVKEAYRQLNQQTLLVDQKKSEATLDYLSIGMMGRLAQCAPKDDAEERILSRLIKRQDVTVKASRVEYLQLTIKPPILLGRQLDEQLKKLLSVGLVVVEDQQPKQLMKDQKTVYTLEKMKALKLSQGEPFLAKKQDIFTPLAQDYLRSKNISLELGRGGK